MPGSTCAVASCRNSSYNAKKTGRTDLSFHSFPKDHNLKAVWILKCRRADKWNPSTSYVCSDHFVPSDFIRDLKAELLGYPVKQKKLNPNVIPSLKLGPPYRFSNKGPIPTVGNEIRRFSTNETKRAHDSNVDSVTTCVDAMAEDAEPQDNEISLKKRLKPSVKAIKEISETEEVVKTEQEVLSTTDNSLTRLQPLEIKDKTNTKATIQVDPYLLMRAVSAIEKCEDECSLFGDLVAEEIRAIKSKSLQAKLKARIQKVILNFDEEGDKNNCYTPLI